MDIRGKELVVMTWWDLTYRNLKKPAWDDRRMGFKLGTQVSTSLALEMDVMRWVKVGWSVTGTKDSLGTNGLRRR